MGEGLLRIRFPPGQPVHHLDDPGHLTNQVQDQLLVTGMQDRPGMSDNAVAHRDLHGVAVGRPARVGQEFGQVGHDFGIGTVKEPEEVAAGKHANKVAVLDDRESADALSQRAARHDSYCFCWGAGDDLGGHQLLGGQPLGASRPMMAVLGHRFVDETAR